MRKKTVVVGSSNTDMVVKVPRIPVEGETIMGTDFMVFHGGKGANQAVAAARTGGDVVFIACVGDDQFAGESIENYKKDNINTSYIKKQPNIHSGIALINVSDDGLNSISVAPGANNFLLAEDIAKNRHVFEEAAIILLQLEIPMLTVKATIQMGASLGIPVILNPAPAALIDESLYSKIYVLTPNETEAALLTSRKGFTEKDFPLMAKELYEKGVKNVIITLGSRGVYLKNKYHDGVIKGYGVTPVDTTAAGDVFNGALTAALARTEKIEDAIDFAQRAAAISVTRMGAQSSIPGLEEVTSFSF